MIRLFSAIFRLIRLRARLAGASSSIAAGRPGKDNR